MVKIYTLSGWKDCSNAIDEGKNGQDLNLKLRHSTYKDSDVFVIVIFDNAGGMSESALKNSIRIRLFVSNEQNIHVMFTMSSWSGCGAEMLLPHARN